MDDHKPRTTHAQWVYICKMIQGRLDFLDLSARKASVMAGLHESAISDILSGRSRNPNWNTRSAIAPVLQIGIAQFLGPEHDGIPVIGVAEDAMHAHKEPTEFVHQPRSIEFPNAKHFVVEVNENVTDVVRDYDHCLRGMLALCVEMESANIEVESGKLYVLSRLDVDAETDWYVIRKAVVRRDHTMFTTADGGRSFELPTPAPIHAKKKGELFVLGRVIRTYSEHS